MTALTHSASAPSERRYQFSWAEAGPFLALAALLLLLALALAWLLGTESGARFALARATGMTAGKLTVERVGGRLGGPSVLRQT